MKKNKNKNMYVAKELLINDELSELDFELYDEFGFNYETSDSFIDILVIKNDKLRKEDYFIDTTPLNIITLEKLIKKFKKKGVTHIAMDHHGDHHGYEFSGFKIELADDELLGRYNSEHKRKNELYQEYNALQVKLNGVSKQIRDLKV